MSTLTYRATNADGEQSLSVFGSNWEKAVAGSHPNFTTLVAYLASNTDHDEDYVRGLVDPTVGIAKALSEHFGDRLTYDLHHLYLDGRPVDGGLADVIKTRLHTGDSDWLRFTKFLVNLEENPSKHAKEAVWLWIEANGLTITEDGRFLGYKAVLEDFTSSSTGPDNYINGEYFGEPGVSYHVPHCVGDVISKRRADVDDTPGGGCSVGLHVGTETYARGFAPVLMTVAVNPRDVVSAPGSDLGYKIRVCEYEVVSLHEPEQFASTSYDLGNVPNPDDGLYGDDEQAEPYASEDAYENGVVNSAPDFSDVYDEEVEGEEFFDGEDSAEALDPKETLSINAARNVSLKADLCDPEQGHKQVARTWAEITTESSVRRWRKANGIRPTSALRKALR